MTHSATRHEIEIELDVRERRPDLADRDAIALLRSEFSLALNASHFIALSAVDPDVDVLWREPARDGSARYGLSLEFVARRPLGEDAAVALVRSEFARALNAGHFLRVCAGDPTVRVHPSQSGLRRAA
jgi:hypothetical protein